MADKKDDDKQQDAPKASERKTFDCTACGGKSKDENTCSSCGTILQEV